jgi:hypothetical protein
VQALASNRQMIRAALEPLGGDAVIPSSGAIYTVSATALLATFPSG